MDDSRLIHLPLDMPIPEPDKGIYAVARPHDPECPVVVMLPIGFEALKKYPVLHRHVGHLIGLPFLQLVKR